MLIGLLSRNLRNFAYPIIDLEVEVGRYSETPKHFIRLCKTCNLNVIEDKFHFICVCKAYGDFRKQLFKDMSFVVIQFDIFVFMISFILYASQ